MRSILLGHTGGNILAIASAPADYASAAADEDVRNRRGIIHRAYIGFI